MGSDWQKKTCAALGGRKKTTAHPSMLGFRTFPHSGKRSALSLSAMNELEVNRGTIITWLDEDSSNDRFEIIPAWKWLIMQ